MVCMDHVNCRGEFGYEFLCTTISKYIIILVKSSCVTEANTWRSYHTHEHGIKCNDAQMSGNCACQGEHHQVWCKPGWDTIVTPLKHR